MAALPSLVTLGNAIAGFASIYYSSKASYSDDGYRLFTVAGYMIFLAMIMDGLDGGVARLTHVVSDFGGQLDSLADVISFGVAPAFLMLQLTLMRLSPGEEITVPPGGAAWAAKLTWVIAAVYIGCAALRLARFNVETADDDDHLYFSGLPSPGAAGAVASMVLLDQFLRLRQLNLLDSMLVTVIPVASLLLALSMVSRVRYIHVFNVYVRGRRGFPHLVRLLVLLVLTIFLREVVAAVLFCSYAVSGPVMAAYNRLTNKPTPVRDEK